MEELKNNLFTLLKKAEKYTKTDNLYLFRGGFFLTLSSVATGILSFLMAIALGWLLPKEVYGNYKYLFSVLGIIALFTLGGMDTAVTQAVARGQDGSFRIGFRKKFLFSFLGTLTAIAIATFYFTQGKDLIAYGSLIVGAFLPLWGPFGLYPAYFVGKGQFRNITKTNVGVQTLVALSIIITAYFSKNFLILTAVNLAVQTLGAGFVAWRILRSIPKDAPSDPKTQSYGLHLSVIDVLNTVATYLDNILVFTLLGPASLAVYNFAMAPAEQIKGLFKNAQSLAMPKFSNKTMEEVQKSLNRKIILFLILSIFIILIYIIFAKILFSVFLPQYLESVKYSQIYALSLLMAPIYIILAALKATSQTKKLYEFSIVNAVFEIVLISVLIPLWGLWGAVLSQVISRIFNFIYGWISLRKYEKIPT